MGQDVWFALGLTLIAGLLGGVMIYVSFVEIFSEAQDALTSAIGEQIGSWLTVGGFFAGMLLVALIDKLVPNQGNPHEVKKVEEMNQSPQSARSKSPELMRMGSFTALAITIHNFPEGIATFTAALQEPTLGVAIAIAVALHNIPEGITVSVPMYYATGSRKKALLYSFLSGLLEPLGAVVAFMVLMPFLNDILFGIVFASVAGIMVFISLDGLIPTAKKYNKEHSSIYGFLLGMAVMAFSLQLLF
ncbi:zinc transporter ZupT [Alkalibacillus silvisoli]|uniref:Zinc transporter ZupT n=1 Tax=Alkalibacillus silvisoli TaxID=392823 RepID=A0ABN0ZYL3_9BACI